MKRPVVLIATLLLLAIINAQAFYLPGVAPTEYNENEIIPMSVNKLTSVHTQLPVRYYDLPFCRPIYKNQEHIVDASEGLGQILMGDVIENSPYIIAAKVPVECAVLCKPVTYKTHQLEEFAEKIEQEYRVHWILDSLPSATKRFMTSPEGENVFIYEAGFPLGQMLAPSKEKPEVLSPALNNHVDMEIFYHEDSARYKGLRIVRFEVHARSIHHANDFDFTVEGSIPSTCTSNPTGSVHPEFVHQKQDTTIVWTYSVSWQPSPIRWASRWDVYLMMTDDQIHWFSIINSLMIVLFLTGMVAMIMMRTLHADLRRYREMQDSEEAQEETGWKLVHGDVFRPPSNPMLLSVSVGSGVQVFAMTVITMVFAVLGFLSPANRGGLMTATVVLLVVMSIFAGYFSSRLYKMFKGKNWKQCTILTATLYPGIAMAVFLVLNVLIWEESAGAVPFLVLLELFGLWLLVSVPLTFFGAYFGYKKPAEEPVVRVNQIPRQIPEQVWYMQPVFSILMGGILPFGAIFIELFFILSSIWLHQFYYLFGFLLIVFVILIMTCAEITIVMCYFQLCSEDYHWWWRSFLTSGASAFYMLLYSIFYFFNKLAITKFVSAILYFGYTFIMALQLFLLTGAIGFYACFFFVKRIYGAVKVE
eukprot:TRINITY_DN957_c0_g1_i1.p1 TRINITY_DN957_c0_g1~~TRINITY_DN957_c0_g1_i1.p1  ORF type:complete len:645 (-),score=84.12 TRINITY_DN957_c0_g1_i1:59-1993(-)